MTPAAIPAAAWLADPCRCDAVPLSFEAGVCFRCGRFERVTVAHDGFVDGYVELLAKIQYVWIPRLRAEYERDSGRAALQDVRGYLDWLRRGGRKPRLTPRDKVALALL